MPRIKQKPANRGSQHWLQQMVAEAPSLFEAAVLPHLEPSDAGPVEWISPIEKTEFCEYQDESSLEELGAELKHRALGSFWPKRGPVWDGLARTAAGALLLVEAKANVPELASPGTQARPKSARLIEASLAESKASFGAPDSADWTSTYYQYTNRLAHLYLLRGLNKLPAYMVFLYFTNATDVSGPESEAAWRPEIDRAHQALGLGEGDLSPFAISAFVDVRDINGTA